MVETAHVICARINPKMAMVVGGHQHLALGVIVIGVAIACDCCLWLAIVGHCDDLIELTLALLLRRCRQLLLGLQEVLDDQSMSDATNQQLGLQVLDSQTMRDATAQPDILARVVHQRCFL